MRLWIRDGVSTIRRVDEIAKFGTPKNFESSATQMHSRGKSRVYHCFKEHKDEYEAEFWVEDARETKEKASD